ncbi:hypothetical protein [Alloactinosynnema sp. L-07]|nr:hypothetical protein [Alloactinosynnema sp. L-07]
MYASLTVSCSTRVGDAMAADAVTDLRVRPVAGTRPGHAARVAR